MKTNICKLCLWVCLLLVLVLGGSATARAEQVYQITETELTRLETNLQQLATINRQQKGMLMQAKFDLEELQAALTECKKELSQAQNSLKNANTLLAKYEKEEQSRRRRIKRQRNFAYGLAGCLLAGVICERGLRK
mgnify:CR=1 FL=1